MEEVKTNAVQSTEKTAEIAGSQTPDGAQIPSVGAAAETASELSPDSREAEAVVDLWRRDAALLKAEYPQFDLGNEMKNKKFRHYLLGGDSIKTAYENLHRAEIMEAYGRNAEEKAAIRLSGMVAAGARFPHENALSSSASGRTKSGVEHLSKSDRADILRRAASGERIVL